MPFVIFVFTLSAFALGLAEFVPIGLTEVMAEGLAVDLEQVGLSITVYALGATFAAPVLSALTSNWSRKRVMLATAAVFTLGSLVAALSSSLGLLLAARFVAGMGHGLFLAVASSTAARLAGPGKAGSAVAVVFGGFTVAMAIGVPLSAYLGGIVAWPWVMGAIAVFGGLGLLGLLLGMRDPLPTPASERVASPLQGLRLLFNGKLLGATLVTVLAYGGSFTAYTYMAPLLSEITRIDAGQISAFMLAYGLLAALGNVLGGKLSDRLGADCASVLVTVGIVGVVLAMSLLAHSASAMAVLIGLLGMFSFASVPALQARLLSIAEAHAAQARSVAAGLNIAGFNSGIALGSLLGGFTISSVGIAYTGFAGALVSGLGLLLLLAQLFTARRRRNQAATLLRPTV